MRRRTFLRIGLGSGLGGALGGLALRRSVGPPASRSSCRQSPPAFSIIPVVGDGKWIWTEPPVDGTGYLEPRSYEVSVGIDLKGRGNATQVKATTTVPVDCGEQKIERESIEAQGCQARIRRLGEHARQLCVWAPQLAAEQTASAVVRMKVTVSKQYHRFTPQQFPRRQEVPKEVRLAYLGESPGIETRSPEVRKLHEELYDASLHPWDLVRKFATWTARNIRPQIGTYTNVVRAITDRRGDCEERSAVLVALCRRAEIPARIVWIPNHNWAEFYLVDHQSQGHWIPAHTAAYHWFGWTGAHELVLQKGDRIKVPERGKFFRLLEDWMQWSGRRPEVRYPAEMKPLAPAPEQDPGPGARSKIASGEWKLVGDHPLDRYMRR